MPHTEHKLGQQTERQTDRQGHRGRQRQTDRPFMTAVDVFCIGKVPRSKDFTIKHDSFHASWEPCTG